jgi:hypothetical protein
MWRILTANFTIRPDRVPLAIGSADDLSNQVIRVTISGAQTGISFGPLAPSPPDGRPAVSPAVNFTR